MQAKHKKDHDEESTQPNPQGQDDTAHNEEIVKLTRKLTETEEIAKRAQSDYLRLKIDFDGYLQRNQEAQVTAKVDSLSEVARKILPSVNQLYHTVKTMPDELVDNSRAQGVKLSYEKVIADLAHLGIKHLEVEIGDDVDFMAHLPLSTQATDDESLKNKIMEVIEPGFIYSKGDHKQIIMPAKVVVGQ